MIAYFFVPRGMPQERQYPVDTIPIQPRLYLRRCQHLRLLETPQIRHHRPVFLVEEAWGRASHNGFYVVNARWAGVFRNDLHQGAKKSRCIRKQHGIKLLAECTFGHIFHGITALFPNGAVILHREPFDTFCQSPMLRKCHRRKKPSIVLAASGAIARWPQGCYGRMAQRKTGGLKPFVGRRRWSPGRGRR